MIKLYLLLIFTFVELNSAYPNPKDNEIVKSRTTVEQLREVAADANSNTVTAAVISAMEGAKIAPGALEEARAIATKAAEAAATAVVAAVSAARIEMDTTKLSPAFDSRTFKNIFRSDPDKFSTILTDILTAFTNTGFQVSFGELLI